MTRDVRKTVCFAVCIAILLAVLGILAWATKGFRNWNAEEWFNYWGKGKPSVAEPDKPSDDSGIDKTKDGAIITDGESKGIQLLSAKLPVAAYAANGISEQADTAFVLTATIEPSETTNKAVDWTVNWKDAASEWATGKTVTDYVTVTATSDGALSASVECKQAFGEQIIITCTSRDDSSLKATCTVDYTEKIISAQLFISTHFGGPGYVFTDNNSVIVFQRMGSDRDAAINFSNSKIQKSVGTIKDTYTWNIEFTPTAEFISKISFATAGNYETAVSYGENSPIWLFDDAFFRSVFGDIRNTSQFYNALGESEIMNTYGCMLIKSTVTGQYSTYTRIYKATFEQTAVTVSATNVSLNNSSIVF